MIKINIYNEPLDSLSDKDERIIFIEKFKEILQIIFADIDGFIDFNYISKYNQFDLRDTDIEQSITQSKLIQINKILENSII